MIGPTGCDTILQPHVSPTQLKRAQREKNFKKIFGNCKSLSKIIKTNNAKSQKNIDLTAVAAPKMLMQIQK